MGKRITTTIIALQLFVTAALCGGACCSFVWDPFSQTAASEIASSFGNAAESHGNCHGSSKSESASPNENHKVSTSGSGQGYRSLRSEAIGSARACVCEIDREERRNNSSSLKKPDSPSKSGILRQSGRHSLDDVCFYFDDSPPGSGAHSPPFTGFSLNLRI
jgi:hypothetical protein